MARVKEMALKTIVEVLDEGIRPEWILDIAWKGQNYYKV